MMADKQAAALVTMGGYRKDCHVQFLFHLDHNPVLRRRDVSSRRLFFITTC